MMRRFFSTALAISALCGTGCAEKRFTPSRVRASNFREFTWWRGQVARDVPPQRWAEFTGAIDEIRFDLMRSGVTGSEAIGEALARRVNGLAFDEVLRMGDRLKLSRLQATRDQLKEMMDANALVGTKSDDVASRDEMLRRATEQRDRLDGIMRQIGEVRRSLVAHGGTPPVDDRFNATPASLGREQARKDYRGLIDQRLENARLMYGDWPARVDRSGADLPPALRSEFEQKRELAASNRHAVIPVYIRAKWRLFDEVVQYPEFSDAVTVNLSPADRRELETAWADSEAEVWARREARKDTADEAVKNIQAELKGVMRP